MTSWEEEARKYLDKYGGVPFPHGERPRTERPRIVYRAPRMRKAEVRRFERVEHQNQIWKRSMADEWSAAYWGYR